jgi:hypothetical protein
MQKPQRLVDLRAKAKNLALEITNGNVELDLSPEDVRFLIMCRTIGFGTVHVLSIHEGKPQSALRVEEKIMFNRDVSFE